MNTTHIIIFAALLSAQAGLAAAAVSADEAKQLGTTLTPWGAEVAGNKEGTIPPYTGGLTKPPAAWDKNKPGQRPDPYAEEKPLFTITAKNMDQYADKLNEGSKAMLKMYPAFRIDVYPSHRSVAFPKEVIDNTLKNATRCKLLNDGLSVENCFGGLPFPIAKSGLEMIWNVKLHVSYNAIKGDTETWYVDGAGRPTLASANNATFVYPSLEPGITADPALSWRGRYTYTAPARTAGEGVLITDPWDTVKDRRQAYQYIPGQRRVKLAPELAYDSPAPNTAGLILVDSAPIFLGVPDRFDWKLVGKKEIFLPYNTYKVGAGGDTAQCNPEKFMTPNHWNPDCVRWELHRAWVLESTLKPGKRHIFSKRVYFLDEDQGGGALVDAYDSAGQLYRMNFTLPAPRYEVPSPIADAFGVVDLLSHSWVLQNWDKPGSKGLVDVPAPPASFFSPDAMAGAGIR